MEHAHSEHAHPTPKLYVMIFAALMVFTGLTVAVAFQDFGIFNNIIALGIAGIKTTLVVLFFMHVKYGSRLTKMFAVAGFLWLMILMGFTLGDTETRKFNPGPQGWTPVPVHGIEHGTSHEVSSEEHKAPPTGHR
ncbi:MAG: cytochrome C oxidase subunit IV family protein [Candidatus Binatia bacterium]